MRTVLTVICSLLIFNGASAQVDIRSVPGDNLFQKVDHLFQAGTLPDFLPLQNKVASGRCFETKQPNKPIATYMVVDSSLDDVGPIQSDTYSFSGMMYLDAGKVPSYFDTLQSNQDISAHRMALIPVDSNTFVMDYPSKDRVLLRYSHPYFVAQASEGGNGNAYRCYYFNVRNR